MGYTTGAIIPQSNLIHTPPPIERMINMNLINFHVTKIISEKRDKVYKLFGMTEPQVYKESPQSWREYLLSDGIKQTYEYWDDVGTNIDTKVFGLNEECYYVGYVGLH